LKKNQQQHQQQRRRPNDETMKQFIVQDSVPALRAFLLVPPIASFTNTFRHQAREKADKVTGEGKGGA